MQIIINLQNAAYSALSKLLLGLVAGDARAIAMFLGFAFLYGVLHAAGPGHGKAIMSSYLLATGDTLKRGLTLTALSSFGQALTAIVVVLILSKLFGFTAQKISLTLNYLDYLFATILGFMGARLLWQAIKSPLKADNCIHIPPAEILKQRRTVKDDALLIASIAIRPCSGAILILTFAISQNLWFYGISAVLLIAFGTFISISILATIATYMKQWAVKLASNGNVTPTKWLEIMAGSFLILMAILLIFGIWSFERITPFGGIR